MKKLIVIIMAVVMAGGTMQAQDLITMRNGDEIDAKVLEVGLDKIRYKKSDNLSGPVYVVNKDLVFMIKYENGDKDVFEQSAEKLPQQPAPPVDMKVNRAYSVKHPTLAWALSFFVVGAGQFYNGDIVKGIGFIAGCGIGYAIVRSAAEEQHREKLLAGAVIYFGSWIFSMIDAPQKATRLNRQNSYLGWNIGKDSYLSLYPDVKPIYAGNSLAAPSYGMGLKLKF